MEAEWNDRMWVWAEKKMLVTFIAGVINATSEVKSKTERIPVTVKAAEYHLHMAGLKWEEVRDNLYCRQAKNHALGDNSNHFNTPLKCKTPNCEWAGIQ